MKQDKASLCCVVFCCVGFVFCDVVFCDRRKKSTPRGKQDDDDHRRQEICHRYLRSRRVMGYQIRMRWRTDIPSAKII
jgi:hypothetical protein